MHNERNITDHIHLAHSGAINYSTANTISIRLLKGDHTWQNSNHQPNSTLAQSSITTRSTL